MSLLLEHIRKSYRQPEGGSLPVLGTTLAAAEDLIDHWTRVLPNPVLQAWFDRELMRYEILPVTPGIARHAGAMRGAFG